MNRKSCKDTMYLTNNPDGTVNLHIRGRVFKDLTHDEAMNIYDDMKVLEEDELDETRY